MYQRSSRVHHVPCHTARAVGALMRSPHMERAARRERERIVARELHRIPPAIAMDELVPVQVQVSVNKTFGFDGLPPENPPCRTSMGLAR
jgi:hypothetical protein